MDSGSDRFQVERDRMVETQIARRGVKDARVLETMRKVQRHLFVSNEDQDAAHEDRPLQIGYHQTISQPYIVAYMTEMLHLGDRDRVLEIGTGSGYQTAVLAELVKEVYSVEIAEPLGHAAEVLLRRLGYRNIFFRIGNGCGGWPEDAPFDKVIVTAATSEIPTALIDQLKDGGRLMIPVGDEVQELIEGVKKNGILQKTRKIAVRFVPLVNPGKENS